MRIIRHPLALMWLFPNFNHLIRIGHELRASQLRIAWLETHELKFRFRQMTRVSWAFLSVHYLKYSRVFFAIRARLLEAFGLQRASTCEPAPAFVRDHISVLAHGHDTGA